MATVHPDNCGAPLRHPEPGALEQPCDCHCLVFWHSHGCHLPFGHDGIHRCYPDDPDPCSTAQLTSEWRPDPRDPTGAVADALRDPGDHPDWQALAFTWDNRVVAKLGAS